jgi:hypothetical protein
MTSLAERIDSLDEELFAPSIEAQLNHWDRRSLLALHAAVAASRSPFTYLEIGSYRGGSLQALIRDPRCAVAMSIDPRTSETPDARGTYTYDDNTTGRMLELLGELPSADLGKLLTFESSTDAMTAAELPHRPDYCFIDGEHSHDAVVRDARFCADAVKGQGLVAFHDYPLVAPAIKQFLREVWPDVSHAIAFPGQVFAVELGGAGVLRQAPIDRAIGSGWHSLVWRLTSRPRRTAVPFVAAWNAMPHVDTMIFEARRRLRRP